MPKFNRFAPQINPSQDDDEDELRNIAVQRAAPPPTPPVGAPLSAGGGGSAIAPGPAGVAQSPPGGAQAAANAPGGIVPTQNASLDAERIAAQDAARKQRLAEAQQRIADEHNALKNPDKDGDGYDDGLDEIGRMRFDQEKERKAAADELAAGKQKALMQASARAGLSGMGLSGAASAQQSDIGRTQDRSAVLAMGELGKRQRGEIRQTKDEAFNDLQRQAALDNLEMEADRDTDGDGFINGRAVGGKIGDGDPNNDPKTDGEIDEDKQKSSVAAAQARSGGTGASDDPFGGIGGYGDSSQQALDDLRAGGVTFTPIRVEEGGLNGEQYIYATGSDGKTYKFRVPGTGWLTNSTQTDESAMAWFGGGT